MGSNDKEWKWATAFVVVLVLIGAAFIFYIGGQNPRCLLSNDPILCLEVHDVDRD